MRGLCAKFGIRPKFYDDDGRFTARHNDMIITANSQSKSITVRWDVNSNRPHMAMMEVC